MAKTRFNASQQGFSLVELLVALAFTMFLMAGMANIYKSSLSTFYTSGESVSSARRNRMACCCNGSSDSEAASSVTPGSIVMTKHA